MYNQSRMYDLAFVSPVRRPIRTLPELVFIVDRKHLEELCDFLALLADKILVYAEHYCQQPLTFSCPQADLFGRFEFGFERCGYVTFVNDQVWLRLQLGPGKRTYHCTLTIRLLWQALMQEYKDSGPASNQPQQLDLMTICDNYRAEGYGHAVGGHVSTTVLEWLRNYAVNHPEMDRRWRQVPVPSEVIKAMREAWYAICTPEMRHFAKDCRGLITDDGRFWLHCFGNACDLSVSDRQLSSADWKYGSMEFSCHNLDNADQQLTLLAGLAKICELARAES